MSISALSNSFYVNTPPVPTREPVSQVDSTNSPKNTENLTNNDTAQVVENKSNTENTQSDNNQPQQEERDSSTYLTGEEILASRPDSKEKENTQELTKEEKEQVNELKARDQEVKTHEQAHIAAGGAYVKGGATYEYQTGPDGKQYAVGGHVNIDTSEEETPEATIAKAQIVIKAALAPAEPSGQDRAVAAKAQQMLQNARKELQADNGEGSSKSGLAGLFASNDEEKDDKSKDKGSLISVEA